MNDTVSAVDTLLGILKREGVLNHPSEQQPSELVTAIALDMPDVAQDVLDELKRRINTSKDSDERFLAMFAIGYVRTPFVWDLMFELAVDPDEMVQRLAVLYLSLNDKSRFSRQIGWLMETDGIEDKILAGLVKAICISGDTIVRMRGG